MIKANKQIRLDHSVQFWLDLLGGGQARFQCKACLCATEQSSARSPSKFRQESLRRKFLGVLGIIYR